MTTHDETSPATGPDDLFEETLILPTGQAVAVPEGGESSSVGGMGRQILQVFLENRLAVVGLFVDQQAETVGEAEPVIGPRSGKLFGEPGGHGAEPEGVQFLYGLVS